MTYTTSKAIPSSDEQKIIRNESRFDRASIVYLLISNSAIMFLLFNILGWIGSFIGNSYILKLQLVGIAIGLVFLIYTTVSFLKFNSKRAALGKKDLIANYIEVIKVEPSEVVRIILVTSNEPIFAFQIDLNKILYLQGQFLYNPSIYGLDYPVGDYELQYSVNSYSGKYAFPNTSFEIRRLPNTGRLLSIKLLGHEMEYGPQVSALESDWFFPDCLIIDGKISAIKEALEIANKKVAGDASHP